MKDLVLKKKAELEEHRRRAHLVGEEGYAEEFSIEAIEAGKILSCLTAFYFAWQLSYQTEFIYLVCVLFAGAIDPSLVLEQIEAHIATVKEEAFSRKDILEKVERWQNACEEEAWLEDYNKVWMLAEAISRCLCIFV